LTGFIGMKPTMALTVKTLGQSGHRVDHRQVELRERAPMASRSDDGAECRGFAPAADGSWLFVIDTPWGLEWE
jgi:hypothetical protein